MIVYDLVKVYPEEVDRIVTSLSNLTKITTYSISNFLESGNYLFVYN